MLLPEGVSEAIEMLAVLVPSLIENVFAVVVRAKRSPDAPETAVPVAVTFAAVLADGVVASLVAVSVLAVPRPRPIVSEALVICGAAAVSFGPTKVSLLELSM